MLGCLGEGSEMFSPLSPLAWILHILRDLFNLIVIERMQTRTHTERFTSREQRSDKFNLYLTGNSAETCHQPSIGNFAQGVAPVRIMKCTPRRGQKAQNFHFANEATYHHQQIFSVLLSSSVVADSHMRKYAMCV